VERPFPEARHHRPGHAPEAVSEHITIHNRWGFSWRWNVIGLETALILILLAYIFGMLTAIKITRA
jgi:hypothetical protein